MKKNNKIEWFWAHRRNASLNHMSIFVRGLHGKGFLPIVNFFFRNQIYIGKQGKGVYIFYDKNELNRKYKDVQKSIDTNNHFAKDFKMISDRIFSELFTVCGKIEKTNLSTLSKEQLLGLLQTFVSKMTVGPIITVQLWGIEACWDESYVLARELHPKLSDREYVKVKGDLSQSTGKSVAFAERESFLKTLVEIQKNLDHKWNERTISLIRNHIKNFEWMHSEYVSTKLRFDDWVELFIREADIDAKQQLDNLYDNYNRAIDKKKNLLERLGLSKRARHAVDALNEFVSERDMAKGKYCYALSCYDLLLDEISRRLNVVKNDLLLYDIEEMIVALKTGIRKDIANRKEGYSIVSIDGSIAVLEKMETDLLIEDEEFSDVFSRAGKTDMVSGVVANTGKVKGKVRVIDDPKDIEDFKQGEILVTYMTTMEFTPIFKKAKGIVTDEGGLSSHAAIISREFGLPCVVGTQIATRVLKTGDIVELDGDSGVVRVVER